MRYLISLAVLTTVLSCNHHHHKEKYGHFSQFGPRFNDYVHHEQHHTHFHGHVAIINTNDPAAALDKLASFAKKLPSPAPTVSVNHQFFNPGKAVSAITRVEKVQYRNNVAGPLRKDTFQNQVTQPLVDVPFSVKVIKGFFSG